MPDNRLLALDDDEGFLKIVSRIADKADYGAVATSQPEAFEEALRTFDPTVILLDLQMPHLDGIEVLRRLSDRAVRATVVLSSGVDARVLGTARELGCQLGLDMGTPLEKPVRTAALREMLDRHRKTVEAITPESLREAIAADALTLHYQPIADVQSRRIVGSEALIRWPRANGGYTPPDRFIPMAETAGLMDVLTPWVAERSIRQVAEWQEQGLDLFVSVNFSADNAQDVTFPDRLIALCRKHGVAAERIKLEMTETAAMREAARTMEVLTRLRLKGFSIAIDDFGTGYSSLVQLRKLPFSVLKVDKIFITDLLTSEDSKVITKAIISLAGALGLGIVAEGIEDEETLKLLASIKCDWAQGYHMGRPMPPQDLPEFIRRAHGALGIG